MAQLGRNQLCRCGSGKKYKKCCAAADDVAKTATLAAENAARRAKAAADEEAEGNHLRKYWAGMLAEAECYEQEQDTAS
jgi:hypothetical protein